MAWDNIKKASSFEFKKWWGSEIRPKELNYIKLEHAEKIFRIAFGCGFIFQEVKKRYG